MSVEPIYNQPTLYEQALPRYEFDGLPDEELLRAELANQLGGRKGTHVLELGCGTGRMTRIIRQFAHELTCVDHSRVMIDACRARHPNITTVHAEARAFAHQVPPASFDLIVACWSLNYPLLSCFETNTGTTIVPCDMETGRRDAGKFLSALTGLVAPGGQLLALWFDPDSDEQRFVTDRWEPIAPFPGTGRDFTHRLLDDHLARQPGRSSTRRLTGWMRSPDVGDAERWFLHGHFKSFPALIDDPGLREVLRRFLDQHTAADGSVSVPAGMLVTRWERYP